MKTNPTLKDFENTAAGKMKNYLPIPTEKVLHQQVCDYLNLQYPELIFTSDASGCRVSIGLRQELKRKRCQRYKVPDLIILHPSKNYNGLVLELKRPGERIMKRNGEYSSEIIEGQAKSLAKLKERGYCAAFAVGFDEAKQIIDDYLKAA